LNSHLTPVERAKEGVKKVSAVELFSKKMSGGGPPSYKKAENNYLADQSGVALAKPEGRRKRWPVKEITRF
jgi:hypothetical protein